MEINLEDIPRVEIVPGYQARFIHTTHTTMAFWEVVAGARMPVHHHMHEQSSQVIEGSFELTVGDEVHLLTPGKIVLIPSNQQHGGVALTDCKLLDIFSPVREDYKR